MRLCAYPGCQQCGNNIMPYKGKPTPLCDGHYNDINGSGATLEMLVATGGMTRQENP